MEKLTKCKVCGNEVGKSAKVCPSCGSKNKKPFYTKWWFWFIVLIIIIAVAVGGGEKTPSTGSSQTETGDLHAEEVTIYETQDLETMIDDLKSNALKAETKYQDKHVEISCKISSFDSDGKYISVKPANADEWYFDSAMCYIKNEEQKNYLMEKSVGDVVTIKGKVKSIGEVFGYSIDIAEVQ